MGKMKNNAGPGHMTKMAGIHIQMYMVNPLKFFLRTVSQMTMKLGRKQKEFEP